MSTAKLVQGDMHSDQRGKLRFFNDFDMQDVVRFYEITPTGTDIIRAWQGHKHEKKVFYCISGAFRIHLIAIDDFENPTDSLPSESYVLRSDNPQILFVSGGFATGIKSIEPDSRLQVFSNFTVEQSKEDDYRFPMGQWSVKW